MPRAPSRDSAATLALLRLSPPERGELAEIARQMRQAVRKRTETLDEQLLELDTLATAGDRKAARDRLAELETLIPTDADVVGWKERLERRPTPARAHDDIGPDAARLGEDLFAGNALSFESKQVFDDKYRGAVIRWSGRVKAVDSIERDSDVGTAGGIRLIATVATIDHDLYGNTDIDAVLGLPAGVGVGLRRGDDISFTGPL